MKRLINLFASLKLALTVLLLIALACIVGTLLPQGADVLKYLEANPDAKARMDLLGFLGLTNVFNSWWFIFQLILLSTSLSLCTFRRFRAALRRESGLRWKDIGSLFTHVSMLLILAGCVVRSGWGVSGYLPMREGETKAEFQVDDGFAQLPFSILLEKFQIEFYGDKEVVADKPLLEVIRILDPDGHSAGEIPAEVGVVRKVGDVRLTALRKISDFVVDAETREVISRSDEMRNPALQLEIVDGGKTNVQWLFAMYPDFNMHSKGEDGESRFAYRYEVYGEPRNEPGVKDYKSTLIVLDDGVEVKKKTIEVNAPLSYKGYTFYQSGYNPDDHNWTSLQVVKDPGVPLVYSGFLMMIIGLAMVFYVDTGASVDSLRKDQQR